MSADTFVENHDFEYPNVESGGSSTGLKMFCQGVGEGQLDIANASRKIKAKEIKTCADNGVDEIIEVRIGYDGLVFANNTGGHQYNFTPADFYMALAAEVMVDGALVPNSTDTWEQVNASFPSDAIRVFIPSKNHGTREVFDTKMLVAGCKATGAYDAFLSANGGDAKAAGKSCMVLREGRYTEELDGGGTETLAKLTGVNNAIGLVGLAFYEGNTGNLQAATISGVAPNTDSIATGEYPVSRPLFMYVKKAHIGQTPGLKEYVQTVLSDEMSGPDGLLTIFGLVSDPEIQSTRDLVDGEVAMGANS